MRYNYIRKTFRHNGKQYQVYGATLEEAITKMVEKKKELESSLEAKGGNMTVKEWFDLWKSTYKDNTKMTAKSLKMYDEKFVYLKPIYGMKLKDVQEGHLQKILNAEAGRSFSHLNKLRSVMTQLFSKARKLRYIVFDPSEDLTLPDYTKGTRRSLTDDERQSMLAVVNTHKAGLWIQTMLYAGLRPGETAALLWGDINFDKNEIHVTTALESGSRQRKDPKTAAGIRTIPIHANLKPLLMQARREDPDLVFPNYADKPQSTDNLNNLWKGFIRTWDIANGAQVYRNKIIESTLADDLVPYTLRHTFCTDLEKAGVPLNVAKYLMGHTDIATTAKIYTHTDTKTLHKNMKKMVPIKKKSVKYRVKKQFVPKKPSDTSTFNRSTNRL